MSLLRRYVLLLVLALGLVSIAEGTMLWTRTDCGATTRNWINPQSRIPGNGYMWTWGVEGNPRMEPDEWYFHVMFAANKTADILLLWNLNQSILFERNSAYIDEAFYVVLPRTTESWRWDWLIRNPHESVLSVENFTVVHYAVKYPERQIGLLVLGTGIVTVFAVPIAMEYLTRRDTRRRSRNLSQSS